MISFYVPLKKKKGCYVHKIILYLLFKFIYVFVAVKLTQTTKVALGLS